MYTDIGWQLGIGRLGLDIMITSSVIVHADSNDFGELRSLASVIRGQLCVSLGIKVNIPYVYTSSIRG